MNRHPLHLCLLPPSSPRPSSHRSPLPLNLCTNTYMGHLLSSFIPPLPTPSVPQLVSAPPSPLFNILLCLLLFLKNPALPHIPTHSGLQRGTDPLLAGELFVIPRLVPSAIPRILLPAPTPPPTPLTIMTAPYS